MVNAATKLKVACFFEEIYDKPRQHIKKQKYHLAKVHIVTAMVFSVVMYKCESWAERRLSTEELKLWCFVEAVVLGNTPESPLDSRETKQVNSKGNQP